MIDDATLLLHHLGLLDPDEAAWLDERLALEPALRRRMAEAVARDPGAVELEPSPWRLPPPARSANLPPAAQLDGAGLRAGGAFRLWMREPAEGGPWWVVVLRLGPAGWQVVAPKRASARVGWEQLERERDGRVVPLLAATRGVRQRWAVALLPVETPVDWDAPEPQRWAPLRALLDEGALPVTSAVIDVA